MPSLYELLVDPATLVVVGLFAGLALWETAAPARALPRVPGWRAKGIAAFSVYFLLSAYVPYLWIEQFAAWQLFDLGGLPTWSAALIGFLVYQGGAYTWHRSMHRSNLLFRCLHQFHHSAERHDVWGAFWFSPLDMLGWITLASLCLVLLVGLPAQAAAWVNYATVLLAIFQHTNVRTPRWLGYLVQRPESHSYHHARGVHDGNFCDLPLIDLLFGTLHNPRGFLPRQGFWDGASSRVLDMLVLRDVTRPPADSATTQPLAQPR